MFGASGHKVIKEAAVWHNIDKRSKLKVFISKKSDASNHWQLSEILTFCQIKTSKMVPSKVIVVKSFCVKRCFCTKMLGKLFYWATSKTNIFVVHLSVSDGQLALDVLLYFLNSSVQLSPSNYPYPEYIILGPWPLQAFTDSCTIYFISKSKYHGIPLVHATHINNISFNFVVAQSVTT